MYLLKPIGNYKTIITSILVYTYEKQSDIISEDFFKSFLYAVVIYQQM